MERFFGKLEFVYYLLSQDFKRFFSRSSSRGHSSLKTVCSVENGEADLVVADILEAIMERVVGQVTKVVVDFLLLSTTS